MEAWVAEVGSVAGSARMGSAATISFMTFRQQLLQRERLCGVMVTLPTPEVADVLARAGCDWLFIDLEHSPFDYLTAQRLLQAAGPTCAGLIRIPQAEPVAIKKALDIGAAGIIVPQVNSPALAADVVRWAKYPPLGERGVGVARAHGYGLDMAGYLGRANEDTAVIIQIEHIDAVTHIDEIAQVEGIDALFIGPYDLSASLGKMGQVDDPEVQAAVERVTSAGRQAGKVLGAFGTSPAGLDGYIGRGYTLLTVGIDAMILGQQAEAAMAALRSRPGD